ncbi:MAG: class I SAM-dependent RNA methyltransferase [Rubrimonas sp.]|uniref:THUMP domain-containing class I SAM-dependent RNA methyltransferase n=1 Tax=Rubrimonas sp. TaxID=2036015 RepID=UPI002FDD8257
MPPPAELEIFLAATPGLEPALADEARALGFADPQPSPGGVLTRGDWPEVWRANLTLRGAGRVLVRVGAFHAVHLAQLDKRAHRLPWDGLLRPGAPVRVDAACRKSRIYHAGAAAERVARAIADIAGAPTDPEAAIRVLVRIDDDFCSISLDASGEPLHKRGFKQDVGKAPLRETLAALFLREAGYRGTEPVLDPMCGSGTLVLEAAEIALGLAPGRARAFAFERFASFNAEAWAGMRAAVAPGDTALRFFGMDRDAGAVAAAQANAERAGVGHVATFRRQTISDFAPPDELRAKPPGLVIVNPPYGERIGEAGDLRALYGTLGRVLRERFAGWRAAVITSEPALAHATGLPFAPPGPPVPHGKLRIQLHRTAPLP